MRKFAFILAVLAMAGCSTSSEGNEDAFPERPIEIVAPASPGGGWDMQARSVQQSIIQDDQTDENVTVVNQPGGGGEVGWQYLLQQDDPHIVSVNSSLLLTGNLLGQTDLHYEDFTQLGMLSTEWLGIATHADAGFDDINEVLDELREDPESLSISVSPSLGSGNHLSFVQTALEAGIDPEALNFLVYDSGGDAINPVLGGHVDILVNSISDMVEQYEAGEVDILAVSAPERLEEFEDVPTLQEEGIDVVFPHWRGIMGPPDMTEDEVEAWEEMLSSAVETDQFQTDLENNDLDQLYMDSEETEEFLEEEEAFFEEIIEEVELAP
ncbi:tripartite tricarboxylate transporter substrate binding protein [Salicibibacter halophilus]|uniref:Tripartite tricarboxylate transporter substrate binding protein n=1 Tax=Salicibibacter halophilus TaxID=2502791 RepID=A0A514LK25_9BACI|nr:tripartite tricarboxylate transporter substrate binding protein [Salicibibacter halophilus]QDI92207.1 tripartite tricarboxylate transporter substrate binding protein [Salicibibacter halophilus]